MSASGEKDGETKRDPPVSGQGAEADGGQQRMEHLQQEMITAVRGAITGVLAKGAPQTAMPDIDLDFSVAPPQLPALRAEPAKALAVPVVAEPLKTDYWGVTAIAAGLTVVGLSGGIAVGVWHSAVTLPAAPAPIAAQPVAAQIAIASPVAGPVTASAQAQAPAKTATLPTVTAGDMAASTKLAALAKPLTLEAPKTAITAPPLPTPGADILDTARSLIQQGRIAEARALLTAPSAPDRSDIALVLARAFDPNFLTTLAKADAPPDIEAARRWYRHWFELATKDGTVPKSLRLDLLLHSLDTEAKQ